MLAQFLPEQIVFEFEKTDQLICNFNFSYSGERLVTSHGGFTLHFLDEKW